MARDSLCSFIEDPERPKVSPRALPEKNTFTDVSIFQIMRLTLDSLNVESLYNPTRGHTKVGTHERAIQLFARAELRCTIGKEEAVWIQKPFHGAIHISALPAKQTQWPRPFEILPQVQVRLPLT